MLKGKPCGNSYISTQKICRISTSDWDEAVIGRKSAIKIDALNTIFDDFTEEQKSYWGPMIAASLNSPGKTVHENGKPYTLEEMDEQVAKRANAWATLIKEGPPNKIVLRNGEVLDAPQGMYPSVTSTGQKGWRRPDDGRLFSHKGMYPKKQGGGRRPDEQNRAATEDTLRRVDDMVDFRKSQKASKKPWPAQELPSTQNLSVSSLRDSLTKTDVNSIVYNGLDKTHKEGLALRKFYEKNPQEREARLNEILERYVAQDGRSGITGKPIAIPGLDPKPGQERSSVDHFQPISTDRAKEASTSFLRENLDKGSNFLLTEESMNSQRSNRPWSKFADVWENRSKEIKQTNKRKPGSPPPGQPQQETQKVGKTGKPKIRQTQIKPIKLAKAPPPPKEEPTQAQINERRVTAQRLLDQAKANRDSAAVRMYQDLLKQLS